MFRAVSDARPDEPTEPPPEDDHAFFGRPRGLMLLSGLEVWERFSFLGMQAHPGPLLRRFRGRPGHGHGPSTAASVSAAYGTMVYPASVAGGRPAGRLADRILGSCRAVLYGAASSSPAAPTRWPSRPTP